MTQSSVNEPQNSLGSTHSKAQRWAFLALLVYGILLAVTIIGSGFKLATGDHARELFELLPTPLWA